MAGFSSALIGAVTFAGLVGFAPPAAAQARGQGFVYGGPTTLMEGGDASRLSTFGGGGEVAARNGAGASIEFGRLGIDSLWVNQVSLDAMYQRPSSSRGAVSLFVVGGYSGFFSSEGNAHGFNFGDGANLWVRPRVAVRLEVRDHVLPSEGSAQALSFRFGVTFR